MLNLGKVFTKQYEEYANMKTSTLLACFSVSQRNIAENADNYFLEKLALLERVDYDMNAFNKLLLQQKEWENQREVGSIKHAIECYEKYSTEELALIVGNWGDPDGPGDYAALCTAEKALDMRLKPLNIYPKLYISKVREKNR